MAKDLTLRQRQVLDFVRRFTDRRGFPPSVREIGKAIGLSSSSTVHSHLNALEQKGFLKRDAAKPRALEISGLKQSARTVSIPLLGRVAAGAPLLAQENIESYFALPQDIVGNQATFILQVKGDSMIGAGINEGDYVVIKKQPTASNRDIVVALVGDEEATVKRFFLEKNTVRLEPENPSMKPILGTDIRILGKVVAVFRKL